MLCVCMYPTHLLFWQVTPQPRTAVPQPHPAAHTTAPAQHHRPSLATDDQKQARSEGKLPVPEVRERRHRQSPSASQQQVNDSHKQRIQQVPQTGEKQQRPRRRSGERESRSRQERQQVSVSESCSGSAARRQCLPTARPPTPRLTVMLQVPAACPGVCEVGNEKCHNLQQSNPFIALHVN